MSLLIKEKATKYLKSNYWIPICSKWDSSLSKSNYKPIKVFDKDFLLVKRPSNTYSLISSICPHRGYNLTKGCSISSSGAIICPYHNYHISTFKDCPGISTIHYPCVERDGFLWGDFSDKGLNEIKSIEPPSDSKVKLTISKQLECNFIDLLINLADPVHFTAVHKYSTGLGLNSIGVNEKQYTENSEYCSYYLEWKGLKTRPRESWVTIKPPLVFIGVPLGNKSVVMMASATPISSNKCNLIINVYMDFDWGLFRPLQKYLSKYITNKVMQEDKEILESLIATYDYKDIGPLDKPGRWILNKFT